MSQKDYYQILGVERKATPHAIREAYRKLAFQYHPDKNNGDPSATQKMKDINEAYAVLSDAAKRQEYDLLGSRYGNLAYDRFRQRHTNEDIFRGSDIDQVLEELARMFGFRSAGDVFRDSYGAESQRFDFSGAGVPGSGFGASPGSQIQSQDWPFSGVINKLFRFVLRRLTGVEMPENGQDRQDALKVRPELASTGGEVTHTYREWGRSRTFVVKVPAGIKDGKKIRLRGMGTPGKAGGKNGDLYLQVKINKSFVQKIKGLIKRRVAD